MLVSSSIPFSKLNIINQFFPKWAIAPLVGAVELEGRGERPRKN